VTGDLDDDQRDDLACVYDKANGPHVGVVRLKDSGFVTQETALAGAGITAARRLAVAIGDADADGVEELLVAARYNSPAANGSKQVRWDLIVGTANTDGAITSWRHRFNTWTDPKYDADTPDLWQLLAGDVDGDGRADLAVVRSDTGLVRVSTSPKNGWIMPSGSITIAPGHVVLADVNGDARADLQVMQSSGTLYQALSMGGDTFAAPVQLGTGEPCFEGYDAADVNGDGRADWLCATNVDANGNGDAPFEFRERISPNGTIDRFRWLAADTNRDGLQDLVYVHPRNPGYEIYTVRANDDGSYTQLPSTTIGAGTELADLDAGAAGWTPIDVGGPGNRADGRTDLVLVDRRGVYTLLSTGDGWTARKAPLPAGSHDLQQWTPAALDRDGRVDLVQFSPAPGAAGVRMERLRSNGDGTWSYDSQTYFAQGDSTAGPLVADPVPRFSPADVNGDGLVDFALVEPGDPTRVRTLVNRGGGSFSARTDVLARATSRAQARAVRPMDFNGDGAEDVAIVRPNGDCLRVDALVSTGGGWAPDAAALPAPPTCRAAYDVADTNNLRLLDVNGDGRTDVVHLSHYIEGPNSPNAGTDATAVHILLNRPGTWQVIDTTMPLAFRDSWNYATLDTNHDGRPELAHVGSDLDVLRWNAAPDALVESANGHGATTRISYRALRGARAYLPAGSLPTVVDTVKVTDAAHSPPVREEERWGFDGATWSDARNHLLGFATRTVERGPTVETVQSELSERCGARARERITSTAQATVLARTVTTFVDPGAGAPYTCLPERIDVHGCEGQAECSLKRTVLEHDTHGNVTETLELGANTPARRTVVDFRPNLAAYVVDRPARTRIFGTPSPTMQPTPADWEQAATTRYVYDANHAWDAAPGARGDLRLEQAWDDNTGTFATTSREYDAEGNETTVTDPVGVVRTTRYDKLRRLFPEDHCSPVGCTHQVWDATLGVVTATEDLNGQITDLGHDAFGRLTSTHRPGGKKTRVEYLDEDSWTGAPDQRRRVRTETTDGSADGVLWQEQLLDGLDRSYMTLAEGPGKAPIVTETQYADASARAAAVSSPHLAGTAPVWTRFTYDAAQRPLRTVFADGSALEAEYPAPGRILTRDPVGREQVREADEFGRAIRIDERGAKPEDDATTTYEYNALDLPETVVDDLGHRTTTSYDSLGRRIAEHAPDRGPRTWTWRADGTPATANNARGQVIAWEYDKAGRVVALRERAADRTLLREARWHWDVDPTTKQPHGYSTGHVVLAEHSSPVAGGSSEAWYDEAGRTDRSRICVDAVCQELGFAYDAAGRLSAIDYPGPDGERVEYAYEDAGLLSSVTRAADRYVYAKLRHDPTGALASLKHGNGLVERFQYDSARHWLDHHVIGLEPGKQPAPAPVYEADYRHYRDAKLMLSTESNPDPVVQRYFYDRLGRLVTVSSPDADRRHQYDYDTIGRLTSSSVLGALQYDEADQVHAPTGTDAGHTRAYDVDGNLTELHDPTTRDPGAAVPTPFWNLDLDWTVAGLPERVAVNPGTKAHDTVSFAYDADDTRVYKADDGGITRWFDRYLEQRPDGGFTRLYWAGDRLLAKRDGGGLLCVHEDRHGSTRLLSDASGKIVQRFEYDPYGKALTPPAGDEQLWAGERRDHDTGLVPMNARTYDPELGHFISADSLVPDLYRPQSLNRYVFTEGDPVNFHDDSGHMKMQVELRKEQQAESPFAGMYNRMIENECAGAFAVSCVRNAPGMFVKERYAADGRDREFWLNGQQVGTDEWMRAPLSPPPLLDAGEPAGSDPSEWQQWPGDAAPAGIDDAGGDPAEWEQWPEPLSAPPLVDAPQRKRRPRPRGSDPAEWAQWPGTPTPPPVAVTPYALTFDMDRGLLWVDTGAGAPYSLKVESGRPGAINDRAQASSRNTGPLPPGLYDVDMSQLTDPGRVGDLLRNLRGDWGDWRVPLVPLPGTNTFGRSGFFIHGGTLPGSAGCVDIGGGRFGNAQTTRLLGDLRAFGRDRVPLLVH
jgi:RHS repeat-associated protein